MTKTPPNPNSNRRSLYLIAGLFLKGVIVIFVIWRIHELVKAAFGDAAAIAIVVILVIVGAIIFFIGLLSGSITEWMVRNRLFLFRASAPTGSWLEKFLRFWGQQTPPDVTTIQTPQISDELAQQKMPAGFPAGTTAQDTEDWLAYINGRPSKGKKSRYSDEQRFRAIRDWRIMQANGTSVTVQEFLEERFGTRQKGNKAAQRVPSSTFYGWWPTFDEQLAAFMDERQRKRKQVIRHDNEQQNNS
jgi:hypothetical protein